MNPPDVLAPERLARTTWRTWLADGEVQWGLRLAVLGPFVTYFSGIAFVMIRGLDPEYGLSWSIIHIAAFSVLQVVWILPVAALLAIKGRRRFAYGLLVGGGTLMIANGLAWAAGLWMGAV